MAESPQTNPTAGTRYEHVSIGWSAVAWSVGALFLTSFAAATEAPALEGRFHAIMVVHLFLIAVTPHAILRIGAPSRSRVAEPFVRCAIGASLAALTGASVAATFVVINAEGAFFGLLTMGPIWVGTRFLGFNFLRDSRASKMLLRVAGLALPAIGALLLRANTTSALADCGYVFEKHPDVAEMFKRDAERNRCPAYFNATTDPEEVLRYYNWAFANLDLVRSALSIQIAGFFILALCVALYDGRRYWWLTQGRTHKRLADRFGDALAARLTAIIESAANPSAREMPNTPHSDASAPASDFGVAILRTIEQSISALATSDRSQTADASTPAQILRTLHELEHREVPYVKDWAMRGLLEIACDRLRSSAEARLELAAKSARVSLQFSPTMIPSHEPSRVTVTFKNEGGAARTRVTLQLSGVPCSPDTLEVYDLLAGAVQRATFSIDPPRDSGARVLLHYRVREEGFTVSDRSFDEGIVYFRVATIHSEHFERIPNPFAFGRPIRPHEELWGRQDILDKVMGLLATPESKPQPLLIYGPRASGKTTVLLRIAELAEPLYVVRYLDASQWEPASAPDRMAAVLERAREERAENNRRGILIVFDELDALASTISVGVELLNRLQDVHLVAAARTHLGGTPLSGRFLAIECAELTRESVGEVLGRPLQALGVAIHSDVIERVNAATGGSPYLVQYLCFLLVEGMNSSRRLVLSSSDVQAAAHRMIDECEPFFLDLFEPVSAPARMIAARAASLSRPAITMKDAIELLGQLDPPIPISGDRAAVLVGELTAARVLSDLAATSDSGSRAFHSAAAKFASELIPAWLTKQWKSNAPWILRIREQLRQGQSSAPSQRRRAPNTAREQAVKFFQNLGHNVTVESENDLTIAAGPGPLQPYGEVAVRCAETMTVEHAVALRARSLALSGTLDRGTRLAFAVSSSPLPSEMLDSLLKSFAADRQPINVVQLDVRQLLDARREGSEQTMLVQELAALEPAQDPYELSKAIVRHQEFFGREELVADLKQDVKIGRCAGIFGMRKFGKSSLLNLLKQKLFDHLVIKLSAQGEGSAKGVLVRGTQRLRENAARLLGDKGEAENPAHYDRPLEELRREFVAAVRETSSRCQRAGFSSRIVLMIDEIDLLVEGAKADLEERKAYHALFSSIRSLAEEELLLLCIVAGLNPTIVREDMSLAIDSSGNPVFQFFTVRRLPFFAAQDTSSMLVELGRGANIQWTEEAVAAMHRTCGGHPYLTRRLASLVVGKMREAEPADLRSSAPRPLQVNEPDVRLATESFFSLDEGNDAVLAAYFRRIEEADPLAAQIMWRAARPGASREQLLAGLPSPRALEAARWLCEERYAFESSAGMILPFSPLLEEWIRLSRPDEPRGETPP